MSFENGRLLATRTDEEEPTDEQLDRLSDREVERRGWQRVAPSLNRAFLLGGLGAAAVGVIVLVITGLLYRRDVDHQRSLTPTQGMVVEQRDQSSGTRTRVILTVRFTTVQGELIDVERTYESGDTMRPAKGDSVTVLYDPIDPRRAEIQGRTSVLFALVAAVGVGFVGVGGALASRTLREWRQVRRRPGAATSRAA